MTDEELNEMKEICPGASLIREAGEGFVTLPQLSIQMAGKRVIRDALLTLQAHSGYTSRLFLSEPISEKGANWTIHTVLGRAWHTPSWTGVTPRRPIEMLIDHLRLYA